MWTRPPGFNPAWPTIGVTVKVNALPVAQYNTLLNAMDANGKHTLPFYIFEWYSWGNDPAFQFTWNFKCGQFTNYSNMCNKELDQIIADLTLSRDPAERQALSTRAGDRGPGRGSVDLPVRASSGSLPRDRT